jgi:NAD(P)-dependent dehydrogenase (short-subunit alcohol dehydrogenase family)
MKMEENKVSLITGSTHGIGKAISLELAKIGFKIAINGASTENLPKDYIEKLSKIYEKNQESKYLFIRADISQEEHRKLLIEKIREKFKRIDVLINNAGVAPLERVDLLEATEQSFDRVLSINLRGPYFLTQAIANWMIELKKELEPEYSPYIINISSISSYTSSPNRGEYCISKAGVSMMTKLYADRLSEYNIPVYEISPGIIDTPMTNKVHEKYDKLISEGVIPLKRWGKSIDIAKAVVAIVKGLIPYSTGSVLNLDGGFHLHRL